MENKPWYTEPASPFFGPYLKIKRANKHLHELHRNVLAFYMGQPCTVVAKANSDPNLLDWVARIKKPMPEHFPVIIGDVVHNLRSALDVMLCTLVRELGQSDKGVEFPTAPTPQDFQGAVKGLEHRAGVQVADVFRSDLQAYPGGNAQSLRTLHVLSRADKHRLLTPIAGNIMLYELRRISDDYYVTMSGAIYRPYIDGAPFLTAPRAVPDGKRFEVGDELKPSFEIAFDPKAEVGDRNVIAFLRSCSQDVTSTLNALYCFLP